VASPAAEIVVSERIVRSLLAEQHPDLATLSLVQVDEGWDNTLWRLGDDLVVRLPRRELAAQLTINEQRWLPELAPRLPLPIPSPVRLGRPSECYPWHWSVVPWLAGIPGDRAAIADPHDAAVRLGRFLRALHQGAPPEAPQNPFRGVPLIARAATVEERLANLASEVDVTSTRRVWDEALRVEPYRGTPVWIHGDLHPANVLVAGGTLAAVIDFGDLCAGDPATDLAGAWMLLPLPAFGAFSSAYGRVDADLVRRSQGWAVALALMLLDIGLEGRPTYERVARSTLARVIVEARQ
jgi:aminoglycoside phosphotransferase (APT) family kinase protein